MDPIIPPEKAAELLRLDQNKQHDYYSPRSRLFCLFLCLFLGIFGAHRFYAGRRLGGFLVMLTLGLFGIVVLIDFFLILLGIFDDIEKKQIRNWFPKRKQGELFALGSALSIVTLSIACTFVLTAYALPKALQFSAPYLEQQGIDVEQLQSDIRGILNDADAFLDTTPGKDFLQRLRNNEGLAPLVETFLQREATSTPPNAARTSPQSKDREKRSAIRAESKLSSPKKANPPTGYRVIAPKPREHNSKSKIYTGQNDE